MDDTTERLLDFIDRAHYDALPARTVHACRMRLIDTFASAFAAYDEPLCRTARNMAQRHASCGLLPLGSGMNVSPSMVCVTPETREAIFSADGRMVMASCHLGWCRAG